MSYLHEFTSPYKADKAERRTPDRQTVCNA